MVKDHKPRKGSMAYYPRKRARSIISRVRRWVDTGKPQLLGFAGYKVGTLHVAKVEDNPRSPFYGQEIIKVATVIETPPLYVIAIRAYEKTPYGLKSLAEVWTNKLPKDLERVLTIPKSENLEDQRKRLNEVLTRIYEIRAIVCTQPRKAGIGKKSPEIFEIKIAGSPKEALQYALSILGGEVTVKDVFAPGHYIDVAAVTKGKGFSGVLKRFGVKEMPRWHKHRKGSRRIGTVGPQSPAIMFTTPFAGQLGFHQRIEYNKRILKIGDAREDNINPRGGWTHYGLVRDTYLLVEGSIPGAVKRLIKMRFAIRPPKVIRDIPKVTYVSTITSGGGSG